MAGPAPPDHWGRLVGFSQHTWLRDRPASRYSRGHGYVPGNESGRESLDRPDPVRSHIRSTECDYAMACPASAACAGGLVGTCPPARLTRGWWPGHRSIPCYELDWILSICLGRSRSHVRCWTGGSHGHHAGLVAPPHHFRRIDLVLEGL